VQAVKTKVSRAEKAELSEAASGRGASMGDNRTDNERAVAYGSRNACIFHITGRQGHARKDRLVARNAGKGQANCKREMVRLKAGRINSGS
jgi:hypothetical protein